MKAKIILAAIAILLTGGELEASEGIYGYSMGMDVSAMNCPSAVEAFQLQSTDPISENSIICVLPDLGLPFTGLLVSLTSTPDCGLFSLLIFGSDETYQRADYTDQIVALFKNNRTLFVENDSYLFTEEFSGEYTKGQEANLLNGAEPYENIGSFQASIYRHRSISRFTMQYNFLNAEECIDALN